MPRSSRTKPRVAATFRGEEHASAALAAARATFGPGNPYGVYGVIVAHRRTGGRVLDDCTLQVFVQEKLDEPPDPVPEAFDYELDGRTYAIRPDVVAAGGMPRTATGGNPRFSGLHPGATIRVEHPMRRTAGVCAILARASQPTKATHLLTAGHLFARGAIGTRVLAAKNPNSPTKTIGRLVANALDTGDDRDIALVELLGAASSMLVRPSPVAIATPGALETGSAGQCYRPTARDWSAPVPVTQADGFFRLGDPVRGVFDLDDPTLVQGAVVVSGDSGSCVRRASDSALAGLVSGVGSTQSFFQPLEPARSWLDQRGGPFTVWGIS